MAKFIQFYQAINPEVIDCVGSDAVIRPDQRLGIRTLVYDVIHKKYPIPTNAVAFAIHQGVKASKTTRVSEIITFINQN